MSTFMGELAKKLAEKWVTLLVLPGLLLVTATATGYLLQGHGWHDSGHIAADLTKRTQTLAGQGGISIALAVTAILLASAAAGLVANATGWLISHLWLAHRLTWPGQPLTWWRRRRWTAAQHSALGTTPPAAPPGQPSVQPTRVMRMLYWWNRVAPAEPAVRRNRICPAPPQRPTWIGDRVAATATRVDGQYGLDLTSTWPRLWSLLPDNLRGDITAARTAFDRTTTLAAWGALYLLAGAWTWWWPAIVVGIATYGAGWYRARGAIVELTDLVESAVDLHATTLAAALGVPLTGGHVHRQTGRLITARARKAT